MDAIWIGTAFLTGLLALRLGLPPLVGYLGAGLALHAVGAALGRPPAGGELLEHVAHLGVLLMLFTIGLKLRLRDVLRPEVLATGLIPFLLAALLLAPPLVALLALDWRSALLFAVALSFSSTVVAAKVLETRRELRVFHGRVAIGVLIVQDLLALAVLSAAGGASPTPYALAVLALPLLRPTLHRVVDACGHGELLPLFGLLLTVAAGGAGFNALGLSSELGALAMGALLAGHRRAQELANALWAIKDVFLVGFFLAIGMTGLPDADGLLLAAALALLLPLKAALLFTLLVLFRLRARSAFLAALSLASYSEFALIVASLALPDWVAVLAVAVALSFFAAAPLNRHAHALYARLERHLLRFELARHHPDEQPVSLGLARVLVMGMGRTGAAAYDALSALGERVVGLDADPDKVESNRDAGRRVLYADAEDPGFWQGLELEHLDAVVLALSDQEARLSALRQLRALGFAGAVVTNSYYDDEARAALDAGADSALLTFNEAGIGLAAHVERALQRADDARQRRDRRV